MTPKLTLGRILATPGALKALQSAGQAPAEFLDRHARRDWGDVCASDGRLNDRALCDGSRVLSVYQTTAGARIWVITEATDESGHRAATTILLPEEY
ncbi:MAG: hypothetical protein ACC628_14430 [Pirellulaceae bacterium]